MGRPPKELVTVAEPFAKHPLVIIASPNHPLAGKRRIPLTRLGSEPFIIREEGSGTRASMEHVFAKNGVPIHATMEVSSNETIKQAVMAGMGISFISIHTVALELAVGKLVTLNVTGLPLIRDWFVIHMRDKRLSPIATAFRAFLLEHGATLIDKTIEDNKPLLLVT
jgi:DNA-binding transcriptional LysR family regulator